MGRREGGEMERPTKLDVGFLSPRGGKMRMYELLGGGTSMYLCAKHVAK